MNFLLKYFKSNLNCERCSSTPSDSKYTCYTCSKNYLERVLCKNCVVFQKKKTFIFDKKKAICINCKERNRRSLSQIPDPQIELKNPYDLEYTDPKLNFSISSKDIQLKGVHEKEFTPPVPLTSSKKVKII